MSEPGPLQPFLEIRPEGLYSPAFEAFVDPPVPAARAIVTHAHSDHAAPGHGELWATPETIAVYRRRNPEWTGEARGLRYGERVEGNLPEPGTESFVGAFECESGHLGVC